MELERGPCLREAATASRLSSVSRGRRIALFGNFGSQNIGNECTLEATRLNLGQFLPSAEIICVARTPEPAAKQHGLPAISIDQAPANGDARRTRSKNRVFGFVQAAISRAAREIRGFSRIVTLVDRRTTLVICGTGVMEDEPTNWLLHILKWVLATRLKRGRVVFLSIGAGPVRTPAGRLVCRMALRAAHYVSYRDERSKTSMTAIGVETSRHLVFPDLAFSLPAAALPASGADLKLRTIAIGLINDRWFADSDHYARYLDTIAEFVQSLLKRGHAITIIHGDSRYDAKPIQDLGLALRSKGLPADHPGIRIPDISTPSDLLSQIANVDMVVASRYHNVVLSLLLGRPTIALSYHFKLTAALADFGMGEFSIDLDELELSRLDRAFVLLSDRADAAAQRIREHARKLSALLDEQYRLAFASDRDD